MPSTLLLAREAAAALLALMGLAGTVFMVASGLLLRRYAWDPDPSRAGPGALAPSVALLKPLHGAEPALESNLRGFLEQDYPGRTVLWLGVQHPRDKALPAAESLAADEPDRVRLVLQPRRPAANAKIGNVMNLEVAAALEPAEVVVLSDSDISVAPHWLDTVVAALGEPRAGLATCLYFGVAARPGLASQVGAMGVSYGFLPQSVAGIALGWKPAMGSTLALRRETLEAVGGFARVKDVLADDFELGRAVREAGLEIVTTSALVGHDAAEGSLAELWRHEMRWAKTIRSLDPLGYAGSSVTHAVVLALLAVLVSGFAPWAVAGAALAIVARLWLKGRVDAAVGRSTAPWWLLPARDVLSVCVFVAAWFARRVDWRGARFHVGRDGELRPL